MHPHTSSFSYRIAAAAARLGVLLTPRGLDDVLTANAVCFLALGFWLPIRHALIERHYFPSIGFADHILLKILMKTVP